MHPRADRSDPRTTTTPTSQSYDQGPPTTTYPLGITRLGVASMEVGNGRGAVDRRQALQCGVGSMVFVPVKETGKCGGSFVVGCPSPPLPVRRHHQRLAIPPGLHGEQGSATGAA